MSKNSQLPLFVSIPHSGESVPPEVHWLQNLDEPVLMRDVDRYVDKLYAEVIEKQQLSLVMTEWHRYVVDLNRMEDEFDQDSVIGAPHDKGAHPKGLHWSVTTESEKLIPEPMPMELHNQLVNNYYKPFHDQVSELRQKIKDQFGVAYHVDLHSMPSLGTNLHPDPGERRADIVISDQHGISCEKEFREIILESYQEVGFQVAYNWPYIGGGVTKRYGEPKKSFHTVQVELNRALYMNEQTKRPLPNEFEKTQAKLSLAIGKVIEKMNKYLGNQ